MKISPNPLKLLLLGAVLLASGSARAQENVSVTPGGLRIAFGYAQVELAATPSDALRLGVVYNGSSQAGIGTFILNTNANDSLPWHRIDKNGLVGIETKAGRLLINPKSAEWSLENAKGETLIPSHSLGDLNRKLAANNVQVELMLGWKKQTPMFVYGCGNGVDSLEQTEATASVGNGQAVIPYYWSKDGYAVLAVTANDNQPARWKGDTNSNFVTWTFPGTRADLYLMPASTLKEAAGSYARLTGAAPVPPRWAFGYLQSRWGWTNRADIEDTLKRFSDLKLPVDAFIYDFEWYTTKPDYELPFNGKTGFLDFGWNTNLFNAPAEQVKAYKDQGVRFVGIRKPRLGDTETLKTIRDKRWDLQASHTEKVSERDLDFADPQVREWYIKQSSDLLHAGVDGWWNDEGESSVTTYYYWNLAESQALAQYRPGERLWSLNRSFSPGTQRFGAGAWTGDIVSKWKTLASTPASLLNFGLAGMPYGACDIGGFFDNPSPELLSRWMEAGVFFPIMRSHSEVHCMPRFPWLYGPDALSAIRKALDLRYQLIPYYYSVAHETYTTGVPLMRPLVMEFPEDPLVANMSDEWMVGRSLLAAPLLHEGGKRSVYLPAGDWYVFGAHKILTGDRTFEMTAALDEIPLYVRAGTILPLAPILEHTSQLPGGPLDLQIYPGKDATFTLVEDDGATTGYLTGKVRRTLFTWDDSKKCLSWKREGNYSGKDVFQDLHVTVFGRIGNKVATQKLNSSGKLDLSKI